MTAAGIVELEIGQVLVSENPAGTWEVVKLDKPEPYSAGMPEANYVLRHTGHGYRMHPSEAMGMDGITFFRVGDGMQFSAISLPMKI